MTTNKFYLNKEELIGRELENMKVNLTKNLDKLPNEELPFMESHLRALYFQSYFLLAYGFNNASIVLDGILLESVTKEKLFMDGISDEKLEQMNFAQAIRKCKEMGILSESELVFLEEKNKLIRNPYAHYNQFKISEGIYFPTWKIENPVEKLISLQERVNKGELTEVQARQELIKGVKPELMSSKEFRPLGQIVKSEKEKIDSIDIFLEIDKFIRKFAEKYFKPRK